MITELLLSTMISTSMSVRTPNDDTKPLDYEYSIKTEKVDGNFTYSVKRDWERGLGNEDIDDVFKCNINIYEFYSGIDYIDKESRDISYTTFNFGMKHTSGLKVGFSLKDNSTLFSTSFDKKIKRNDLEYNIGLSVKTDLDNIHILNMNSNIKKWFNKKFNIFGSYKHEYYNEKEDFQFKIGIGVKL